MQVNLTVVGGLHDGRTIPLKGPEFTIGRDPQCHLRPASNEVGRQHCALVWRDDRVFLRDHGSRNGTQVNRRALMGGELQLVDGDVLEVGPLVFRLALIVAEADVTTAGAGAANTETDDDILADVGLDGNPSPDETVLVPKHRVRKPGDANELLCLDE